MRSLLLVGSIVSGLIAGLATLAAVSDRLAGDDGGPCGSPLYCDTFQGQPMIRQEPVIATDEQGAGLGRDAGVSP